MNGVRSRFVPSFPTRDVPRHVILAQRREEHGGGLDTTDFVAVLPQADAGEHFMTPAGQPSQHRRRLFVVARLAKDVAIDDDGRIRGEDKDILSRNDCSRPVGSEAPHVG